MLYLSCRVSVVQQHRINCVIPWTSHVIWELPVPDFQWCSQVHGRTRVRARLLVVPIACSARQAYRWFYIWVPCSHFIQYRQRFRVRRGNVVFYYTDQTWSLRSIADDHSSLCWSKLNDTIFSMLIDLSPFLSRFLYLFIYLSLFWYLSFVFAYSN